MVKDDCVNRTGEWQQNWPLVLCSLLGIPVPIMAMYSLGQFMPSLEKEFGWSRTEISIGMSVALVLAFLFTPIAGRVVDRVNARPLVLIGLVFSGLVLASFSLTNGDPFLWFFIWACHALAAAFVGPAIWLAVISSAFARGRSLAMAISLCGVSLPAAVAPPLARVLIDEFGWRSAYQLLALIVTLPALAACGLFFFDRRSLAKAKVEVQKPIAPKQQGSIFISVTFLKLAFAVLVAFTASAAFVIHLAPALSDKGLSPMTAATVAGVAGLAAIPGKIALGAVFDRVGTVVISGGLMLFFALTCTLLALPTPSLALALVASVMLGISAGGLVALLACMTPRLFAPSMFGSVYAVLLSLTAMGGALGPLLVSLVHDISGSYAAAFWTGAVAAIVSGILFISATAVKPPSIACQ